METRLLSRGLILALFMVSGGLIADPPPVDAQAFRVEPAPEWDALFDRQSGWTGADGIYSIPLDGDESPGAFATTPTFFVFSDTFIGEVLPDGRRSSSSVLVNNTLALRAADPEEISPLAFYFARDVTGEPTAVFVPEVPGAGRNEWYWMKDGIALGNTLYLLAARFERDQQSIIRREGVSMIEIPMSSRPPFEDHIQRDVPLTIDPSETNGAIVYGGAIMPNTVRAGAPEPDGFIYVYGTEEVEGSTNKRVMVARVPESAFAAVDQWRFFDGSNWVTEIDRATAIADRASNELSVSPLPDGRYVMVFQLDQIRSTVAMRVGSTPWGPFGPVIRLYDAPEAEYSTVYTYNAKAHPHLSKPGELLISYNVNTGRFKNHFRYADIYRPRFFRLIAQ